MIQAEHWEELYAKCIPTKWNWPLAVAEELCSTLNRSIGEELKEYFDHEEIEIAKLVHGLIKSDEFEKELDDRFHRLQRMESLMAKAQTRASEVLSTGMRLHCPPNDSLLLGPSTAPVPAPPEAATETSTVRGWSKCGLTE